MRRTIYEAKHTLASILLVAAITAIITASPIMGSLGKHDVTATSLPPPSRSEASIVLPNLTITPLRNLPHVNKIVIPPKSFGRGVIAMIGSAEDALKRGLGVVQISVIGPHRIHVTPGKPVTIEVRVTYIGGSSAPATVTLNLGRKSSFKGYIFVPAQYVDRSKLPPSMKPCVIHKPIVYEYSSQCVPHYVLLGYKNVRGYYVPQYTLLKFSKQQITLHKNSSKIIKVKMMLPEYITGGTYSISPPVNAENIGLYVEDDSFTVVVSSA